MHLGEFKELLAAYRDRQFRIVLPSRDAVPICFHITEVARVDKTFIDCGGATHARTTCQLQVWVGEDHEHRLNAGKIADILRLAERIVPDDAVEVEIEYEDTAVSQYPVRQYEVTDEAITLQLEARHTDCLAKHICLTPTSREATACCEAASGCC